MSKKTIFTEHDLVAGLDALDEALEYFSDLKSLTPLQLITCGGFTALRYLKNRESTRDLDYFLHPRTPIPVREALKSAISSVGKQLEYAPTWCNDDVALFVNLLNQPDELFNQSVQQGLVLYSGRNLQVYTVKWIWLLVRKMKRLQMLTLPPRMEDLKDCVSIANIIHLETGAIGKDMLQQFDHSESEPPIFWSTAKAVGDMVAQAWGHFPFILEGLPED